MSTEILTDEASAASNRSNSLALSVTRLLGLTTGVGVMAWGVWSLVVTVAMTFYERTGLSEAEIIIEDSLNQGLLQSAMVIALGAIILELRRLNEALGRRDRADG